MAGYIFGGLILAWLLFAAVIVDIEYYDGLSAICNARFFLQQSDFYFFDRGPLMAWIQMPAEAVRGWLKLDPLQVRTHHGSMALVHAGYLAAVFAALVRCFGAQWPVLIAFATAITSYVFFSYAPFLSHDIAPGALLLWMVIWSDKFAATFRRTVVTEARRRKWHLWVWLVAAGVTAALVKQTYGVFWIAVLGAHLFSVLRGRADADATSTKALVWLAIGAGVSAVITWAVYGIVLTSWAPDVPLWLRPYRNLQYLAGVYDGIDVTFPVWIYLRNFWAYGRVTTLLLIPGLLLALGTSGLPQRVAVTWVIAVVFVHLMPLREVRYLAFVAPLSAFLMVPALRMFAKHRLIAGLVALLLIVDLGGVFVEAFRISKPFYRKAEVRNLVEPLSADPERQHSLFFNLSMLSFVAPDQSPLAADRYHRVFHVGAQHLALLYGYPASKVRIAPLTPNSPWSAIAEDGSVLLFSNEILAYGPTWDLQPPPGLMRFVQGVAILQTLQLRRTDNGTYDVMDRGASSQGRPEYVLPVAIDGNRVLPLQQQPDGTFSLRTADAVSSPGALTMRAFVVRRQSAPVPGA